MRYDVEVKAANFEMCTFFDAEDFSELANLVREVIVHECGAEYDFEYISVYDENDNDVTDIASKYI